MIAKKSEHQQDSIKGKWEGSGAVEHSLKCHGQFNWLHPKTLSREARYKNKKIRKSLEIKRSKCSRSKLNINRNDGNLVKTNTWTPLLIRKFEHQQDSINGKWESSGAMEHSLKFHGQFNWLQPETSSREARHKSRKIRKSLEIKS